MADFDHIFLNTRNNLFSRTFFYLREVKINMILSLPSNPNHKILTTPKGIILKNYALHKEFLQSEISNERGLRIIKAQKEKLYRG